MSAERLPVASPDTIAADQAARPILIVDDEPAILEMLRDVLEDEGFGVVTADNGAAALRLLQKISVGLVLMDFMMPGLNGLELADQLRQQPHTADLPLILMSAVPPSETAGRFLGVIPKPFALDLVVRLVRQFYPA